MCKTLLFAFTLTFSTSIVSAQVFPLDAFGAATSWGRPAFVDGEWVSILTASRGTYLVEGDTARFLTSDRLDRVLYDGERVIVLNDGDDRFLPTPTSVSQLTSDRRALETEFSPTIGGFDFSMLDVVINETTSQPVYLASSLQPFSGQGSYAVATYFDDGYYGEIGRLRGVPYLDMLEHASYAIGVGVNGQTSVFISRIPRQDKSLPNGAVGYAYGVQVVNATTGVSVDRYTELRGLPIEFVTLTNGFALVTTADILFLNGLGEEISVVRLPDNYNPISASANESAAGVYVLNSLDFQAEFQTLLEVNDLGVIASQYQTLSNQTVLQGIYRSNQNELRVQGAEVGTPFWVERGMLSDIPIFEQVAPSFPNLRYDAYPYVDTLGRSTAFGYAERYAGDSTYLEGVHFTVDGNIHVDFGLQAELRSPSGQYMGEPSTTLALDSTLVDIEFQDRLSIISNAQTLKLDDASLINSTILWTASAGVLSSPIALPGGLVLVTENSDRHIVLDTFGNLQTILQFGESEPTAFEQGLILTWSEESSIGGLLLQTIEGYRVYPYAALKKPAALTGPLSRCKAEESITFFDENIGANRTISYDQNSTLVSLNGVVFQLDVVNQLIPANAIRNLDVQRPCEGGNGSLEVILTDPRSIDSVFIDGQFTNPLVFSGTANHDVRLVDTAGCVADSSVFIASHRFGVSVSAACYGFENGMIEISGADSIWVDMEYSAENEFRNLGPGDYLIEAKFTDEGCSLDTVVTIVEQDSIGIAINQVLMGDSVLITANPLDPSFDYRYGWNTTRTRRGDSSFVALLGDTVVLKTLLIGSGCSRSDTIYTQRLVNTFYPANRFAISAYPNPVKDQLTVEVSSNARARLIDAYGRIVREWQVQAGRSRHSLSGLPSGNYTLLAGHDGKELPIRILKLE